MAGWTKLVSQVLIHLNDQPAVSIVPYVRLGTPAETSNTLKVWEAQKTAIALTLIVNQCAMLLRTANPMVPEKALPTGICNGLHCQG